jgi:regulator of sigma E protease
LASVAIVLGFLFNVLKVVFGLGFVIFIHELGHFLAAKWAGVKVEKFFLGFDPYGLRVASFRRGETLYGIGAIPLGGYVKMLGESQEGETEETDDPRAFSNKSVGARTVILSAGVVMNLILGMVLFAVAYLSGVEELPAILEAVEAGSPAYEAGLRPGDEIVAIDGRRDVTFQRLMMRISLSAADQALHLTVHRPGVEQPLSIDVVPRRQAKSDKPTIGISPGASLSLVPKKPYEAPPGIEGAAPKPESFPEEGKVVEAGPASGPLATVADSFGLDRIFVEQRVKPIDVVIEAPAKDGSAPARARATLPVVHRMGLGLRASAGPVVSIQRGSIAEKADFRKGDRIVKVEGDGDFDPLRLPESLFDRAGKPTKFVVERDIDGKPQAVELSATPDDSLPDVEPPLRANDPLKLPGIGLAIDVEPKVTAVAPGSVAAKAGIAPGAVIAGVSIPSLKEREAPRKYTFGKPAGEDKDAVEASWPYISYLLQEIPRREIKLTLAGTSTPVALQPEPDRSWAYPLRGLNFLTDVRALPPQPLSSAVRLAWDDTYDNVVGIYAMIRSLFQGRISPKNLAGLPRIAEMSYHQASMGWTYLLQFLGMLSINLAVLNFLPIPPLDGGQIVFLIAEKIRGKPLPDSALTVLMIAGLALVVFLMLFTILQDIYLMVFG